MPKNNLRTKQVTMNFTDSEYRAIKKLIPLQINISLYCRIEILQRIEYENDKPTKTGRKK